MFVKLTKCTDEALIKLSEEGKLYNRFEYRKTKRSKPVLREVQIKPLVMSCDCEFLFVCDRHRYVSDMRPIIERGNLYVKVD